MGFAIWLAFEGRAAMYGSWVCAGIIVKSLTDAVRRESFIDGKAFRICFGYSFCFCITLLIMVCGTFKNCDRNKIMLLDGRVRSWKSNFRWLLISSGPGVHCFRGRMSFFLGHDEDFIVRHDRRTLPSAVAKGPPIYV
ncbi:uncharacterized protein TM35_000302130 [Trypanosoma theileri]|uniref:Uncharacterized protein n=1 Tax=Trypanosoma theileri TaxID=67003 RepID=A0A1X0NNV0_9TRYP|nr:uncharacterized protein TM35_000302130 [Trypanosoma theileri]ORC86173.1 hypothetical protein TM35_000302130 [Trypanosoma theileri]